MRQIVLDTETTGRDPLSGDRVIEIGAILIENRQVTDQQYQTYINPERSIDHGALKVHGLTEKFLSDKPLFSAICDDFIDFVTGAELVIHNAPFDIGFLNMELNKLNKPNIDTFCTVLDTLPMARKKHPGQRNSLDALCKRYGVDSAKRVLHGALLDASLLAQVYLLMTSDQTTFFSDQVELKPSKVDEGIEVQKVADDWVGVAIEPSQEELVRHRGFVEFITQQSGINLWDEQV